MQLFRVVYFLSLSLGILLQRDVFIQQSLLANSYWANAYLLEAGTWILALAFILIAIGFKARTILGLAVIIYFFYNAPLSWSIRLHYNIFPFLVMCLLWSSHESRAWHSFDFLKGQTQPIETSGTTVLIKLMIALTYLGAGLAKLKMGGWAWFDGSAFSNSMYERALLTDNSMAYWIASNLTLCLVLGLGSLLTEATFWITLVIRKLELPYAALALSMHVAVLYVMNINFLTLFAPVYWIYLIPVLINFGTLQEPLLEPKL